MKTRSPAIIPSVIVAIMKADSNRAIEMCKREALGLIAALRHPLEKTAVT
jgi:hypothetical protein